MPEGEIIRTVLGDIKPSGLGWTNMHEHLLMRSPLLRDDELDDVDRSSTEGIELQGAGIEALVELTPIGLGRHPLNVAKIAERSHLHIVLAAGIHQQAHYPPEHWICRISAEGLADLFIPRLRQSGGDDLVRQILVANRRRYLAFMPQNT